ncbi:MAG: universal stress protein [Cyclobacteriaceae bacterium]|nr:universal stress protein [Cyclobacteriaceae bacterium]MCB0498389.1 universal stress protein [Cyclobacteriaceae bacterium]MCB9237040.1 universal stress protein [Flammeovirgaceae bacterium]MCO5271687.1 universal stress protein [Cyclobacteriaceae bacterium]MCW5901249.1 universal stress protein [Cyclobacteriaceae bacterium]
MKKILVPCDFSDSAVQAFKFAVEVANQSKGEVLLLNVVELPVIHENIMMPTFSYEGTFLDEMKQQADKDFAKMISKWAKEGPKVSTFIQYGAPTPTISQFAKDKKADLIIMGTKGASGLKEFFVGSNTEKIVRWSPVPVMAIKKSVKASSIKNIVFPTTLGDGEEELTMKVKALQAFFKAKLHVLNVNTPANFRPDVDTRQQMKDFAKRFMLKDYTLNVYNDLNEERGVANFIKEVNGDMVAMATHGRKGLNHLMGGSIAEDVVNHIECPIWTWKTK